MRHETVVKRKTHLGDRASRDCKALVQELARHDAIIIASSRSLTNLEELQKECQYPNLHLYPFDVSKKKIIQN